MNAWTFLRRGLRHYRGSYAGVFLAAALGAMVLLGALFAGASVKGSLEKIAELRLGRIAQVFSGGDRFFREALADELGAGAPVMLLRGQVSARNGEAASGGVQVLGVNRTFWDLSPSGEGPELNGRQVAVNRVLADRLGVAEGDSLVMRLQQPGLFSRDAPLSGEDGDLLAWRAEVTKVLSDEEFGRFSLQPSQLPPASIFVSLEALQKLVDYPGRVNALLFPEGESGLVERIQGHLQLEDFGVTALEVPLAGAIELRSERIFLDPHLVDVVTAEYPAVDPVVTYLATTIAANQRETPYSMVTAVNHRAAPFLPDDLAEDGIVLNAWEAEDLGAKVGDPVRVDFWKAGRGGRLVESSAKFRVAAVVPLEGAAADRLWMPDFPGVADAEDSSDWTPGMPIDLTRIRDKDEDYWDEYRGTPKAFISLSKGQALWANRWGDCTAMRLPADKVDLLSLVKELPRKLSPDQVGLVVRDVGSEARKAAGSPVDIAGLFLSMSFFLIVAAVALVALLFRFNVELRNKESGLLAALGIPGGKMLRWRMAEALVVVAAGSAIGIPLAMGFSIGILRFLETIWGSHERLFAFEMPVETAAVGLFTYMTGVMVVVFWASRRQAKRRPGLRLEEGLEEPPKRRGLVNLMAIAVSLVTAAGAVFAGPAMGTQGAFFLAGAALLSAGLLIHRRYLGMAAVRSGVTDARRMARLNAARRPSRTGVVVGILACGVFLVVSVAAFRKGTSSDWTPRDSGTGGYALWVETASPVNRGSEEMSDPDWLGLGDERNQAGEVLPIRMGEGTDASCFNLNTVPRPRLLGVDTAILSERDSFSIKRMKDGLDADWRVLGSGDVLRAFVDDTTLLWALKLELGARIPYRDERGREFEVEIVGTLEDSVFQGHLLVDEEAYLERYPSSEGYGLFLAESQVDVDQLRSGVSGALIDHGAEVMTTVSRLKAFHEVENTYIAIFHVLGGLGVVLGSAGLGLVTARNLSERRYEFAVMRTIGVPQSVTRRMVFREVGGSIRWGLGIGVVAALVSILPNLSSEMILPALGWVAVLGGLTAVAAWGWAWLGYRGIIERVSSAAREFG